jgi:hypothetical protein
MSLPFFTTSSEDPGTNSFFITPVIKKSIESTCCAEQNVEMINSADASRNFIARLFLE